MLPGFQPDSKVRMLLEMKDEAEIVIAISADDIERSKRRGDLGITYDEDTLRLIDAFRGIGLYIGSVVITHYRGQSIADKFKKRLEALGVPVYFVVFDKSHLAVFVSFPIHLAAFAIPGPLSLQALLIRFRCIRKSPLTPLLVRSLSKLHALKGIRKTK